ncbi:ribosomal maturation YjgA family protein [Xanthomonas bonasiae]|jgi:hypothetical protein|uniref:ribosomal maturation YjgA family protein n=1 Tax=Xanthomonas bonasiae TaxID=2810351 RepID=UPI00177B5E95|nr:DUF2809 domain-containing protein [Xanthomonas surreyensis]MBD7922732.1 DUF2809 domain-containing protein [Xanthomonas surreyensis]
MPVSATARRRLCLIAAIVATIAAGLASRQFPWLLPSWLGKFPGDALWALMVYLGLALLAPRARPLRLAVVALAACWLVEASQLYRAPWLDALRATTVGHLALGSTFVWMDLLAYAVGVAAGAWLDLRCTRR